jgi:SAM-dependent methyltransferase
MNDTPLPAAALAHLQLFRRSFPLRLRLQELVRALGPVEGLNCLEAGASNGAVSHHLRKIGGTWTSVAVSPERARDVVDVLGGEVAVYDGQPFAFGKKSFDAVVIVDSLERIPDDARFIEECHKVLRPDGRLVLNVRRVKTWSLIRSLRRLLGVGFDRQGLVREGYTESELFNVLKDGFDVLSMRTYSKVCMEFVDLWVEWIGRRLASRGDAAQRRLHSLAGPVYWLAFQIDLLLVFNRGFRMIAVAKRRAWRPRKTPVLVDGRSLTEAVLSRAAQ